MARNQEGPRPANPGHWNIFTFWSKVRTSKNPKVRISRFRKNQTSRGQKSLENIRTYGQKSGGSVTLVLIFVRKLASIIIYEIWKSKKWAAFPPSEREQHFQNLVQMQAEGVSAMSV